MASALTVMEAVERICSGVLKSVDLTNACLTKIDTCAEHSRLWQTLDTEAIVHRAAAMDTLRQKGRATGSLHGLPIAVESTFGSADVSGCGLARSAVQEKLIEAGAVPFANASTGLTARTVAEAGVPLAITLHTNDCAIREASNTGCIGFTPSRGVVSRFGSDFLSPSLDQVAVFGPSIAEVAYLVDAISGYDARDPASFIEPKPAMLVGAQSAAPVSPSFAWFNFADFAQLNDEQRAGFEELLEFLGSDVEHLEVPKSFQPAIAAGQRLYHFEAEQAKASAAGETGRLNKTRTAPAEPDTYAADLAMIDASGEYFDAFFIDYDAIIAPCIVDPANEQHSLWSMTGLPCLSLPWLQSASGAPVGVQLIGSRQEDNRLLRTASWLNTKLEAVQPPVEAD